MTEATFPDGMSGTGRTTFEWALGGAFLLQRAKADVEGRRGPVPDRGRRRRFIQHYFDSRGVVRRTR